MQKETKQQRNRRYYIHRVLKKQPNVTVQARQRIVNVPYDLDLAQYPKIKELQQAHYNIQTTII